MTRNNSQRSREWVTASMHDLFCYEKICETSCCTVRTVGQGVGRKVVGPEAVQDRPDARHRQRWHYLHIRFQPQQATTLFRSHSVAPWDQHSASRHGAGAHSVAALRGLSYTEHTAAHAAAAMALRQSMGRGSWAGGVLRESHLRTDPAVRQHLLGHHQQVRGRPQPREQRESPASHANTYMIDACV